MRSLEALKRLTLTSGYLKLGGFSELNGAIIYDWTIQKKLSPTFVEFPAYRWYTEYYDSSCF